ncbi:hypothetical protein [Nonomuraea angiospora]|uniref:hypothetical protein n=1 Tax=Nonomuraea angiospora TaxID=46172 RepID=UPI0029B5E078|nr:hypothetical protein [Nonomuraea angiospora]MDX3100000.1 hypothetical protein [Nonomuraea angiospora]
MRHPGPFGFLLEGWQGRSVWGWDEGTGSWWAQLWRNDLPDDPVADAPHVSIGPLAGHHISAASGRVPLIAAATGEDADRIDQLLAESMR